MAWIVQKEEAARSHPGLNTKQIVAKASVQSSKDSILNWSLLWSLQQTAVEGQIHLLGETTALHPRVLFRVQLYRQWH